MRTGTAGTLATVVLLALGAIGAAGDGGAGPCGAPADHPGGDWPSYGHDLENTRNQPLESTVGPEQAGDLAPAWAVDSAAHGGGAINTTPVVADGCLYLVPSSGTAMALDADTGELVWSTELDADPPGYGGGVVGAPAVDGERLVVAVNRGGSPYLAALDRSDGTVLWTTVVDETPSAITNASVRVFEGKALLGFSGSSGGTPMERGGFVVVDTATGELLAKTRTIPDDDFAEGYGGASIWSTAAVDAGTRHAYVGTGNPHSDEIEHEHSNAIIKIDLDEERPTFGHIVDVYKGDRDQYVEGLDRQPACRTAPDVHYFASFSATCAQLDLDFGASPNLFRDARGDLVVGALQKSGAYHAVRADTMTPRWRRVLGTPCFACNAASASFDGERIVAAAVPPGQAWGLEPTSGDSLWVAPIADGLHYQSVSTANGVAYVTDTAGFLNVLDAATGELLAKRPLRDDTGSSVAGNASSGIALARNTVYVAAGSFVVAYRAGS